MSEVGGYQAEKFAKEQKKLAYEREVGNLDAKIASLTSLKTYLTSIESDYESEATRINTNFDLDRQWKGDTQAEFIVKNGSEVELLLKNGKQYMNNAIDDLNLVIWAYESIRREKLGIIGTLISEISRLKTLIENLLNG